MTWLLRKLAAVGATVATAITLLATHWPTPRAVEGGENAGAEAVRSSWRSLGEAADRMPSVPSVLDPLFDDKVLHLLLFFWPALLWSLSLGRRILGPAGRKLVAVLTVWSVLDEATQSLTGREVEWADAATNLLGVVLGVGLAALGARWRQVRV